MGNASNYYSLCSRVLWFRFVTLYIPPLTFCPQATNAERIRHIDKWLTKLQETHRFNGVVLIAQDNEPLLCKAYGFTDHQKNQAITTSTPMRLASLSKQFTAAGILILHDRGQLQLDDLVEKHLPEFPYPGVSIRHLLNQTSGIPDNYLKLAKKHKKELGILTNEKAVALVLSAKQPPLSQPNQRFSYSNTNYILLAHLIEQITSTSLESFLRQVLFEPLGMQQTSGWNLLSSPEILPKRAKDFEQIGSKAYPKTPSFIDGVAGDGAVFSSANDLLIWDQFWHGNVLIQPATMTEAFKWPKLNDGTLSNYGFGWVLTKNSVWHNGAWLGARTVFIRHPKQRNCLALLDNSDNPRFDRITNTLQGALLSTKPTSV